MSRAGKRMGAFFVVLCVLMSMGTAAFAEDSIIIEDVTEENAIIIGDNENETEQAEDIIMLPQGDEDTAAEEITIEEQIVTKQAAERPLTARMPKGISKGKELRILAIGNSFTQDTLTYLYPIAESAGYSLTIGVLNSASAALKHHVVYLENACPAYDYEYVSKKTGGEVKTNAGVSANKILRSNEWDIVVLQQHSFESGNPNSYYDASEKSYLTRMTQLIRQKSLNPSVKFAWLMSWAVDTGYQDSRFERLYDGSQEKMFWSIVWTLREDIWKTGAFDFIIPAGTMIQNMRTSYLGDTLTRDGKHLTHSLGRYGAALSAAASLGIDVDTVSYLPTGQNAVSSLHLPMLRQAAKNAVNDMYNVTGSKYRTKPATSAPKKPTVSNTSSGIKVQWSKVSGATSYDIYRKTKSGSTWSKAGTAAASKNAWTDKNVSNGTQYSYYIKANFDSALGSTKSPASASTLRLNTPKNVQGGAGKKSLTVQWSKNSAAGQYQVRYADSASMSGSTTKKVTNPVCELDGLSANKTYYIQVRARKKVDSEYQCSAWSSAVSCKTK